MLYSKHGETLHYEGIDYTVGQRISANVGNTGVVLFGEIFEIRTDEDRETENEDPDIYVCFESPTGDDKKVFEEYLSSLYCCPKSVDDVGLDFVIVAPDMITVVQE